MPFVWTHCLFGQALMHRIGREDIQSDGLYRNVFQLGCQGPDFLFFHNFWPWKTNKKMIELGGLMHGKHCGPVLADMADSVRGRRIGDPLVLYVLGFLTHHVLDRNMHPYVFYRSGFKKWNHQRFEAAMDTLLLKQLQRLDTWKVPVWKQLDVGPRLPEELVHLFERIGRTHYPDSMQGIRPQLWHDAYRDMIAAYKIFHDPFGWKRLATLGKISPMVYKRNPPPGDFLNENRTLWRHPSIPEETSDASVWDLWDAALTDGEDVLFAVIRYLEAPAAEAGELREEMIRAIGNRSYETGKPCELGLEILHADPIL